MVSGLNDERAIHKKHNNIFVAALHCRLWEQCIISWLRSPGWNPFISLVELAHDAELCFESHHRKSMHLLLYRHRQVWTFLFFNPGLRSSLFWLNRRVVLLLSAFCTVQVWSFPPHWLRVSEPRNLPCHWDKDRNGVRACPTQALSELGDALSLCSPPPVRHWSCVLGARRGNVNKLGSQKLTF